MYNDDMITKNIDLIAVLNSKPAGQWVFLTGKNICQAGPRSALVKRGWAEEAEKQLADSGHMTIPMRLTEAGRAAAARLLGGAQ